MDERSPWDDREVLTETELALMKITSATELSAELLERIAQIIREDGDARAHQISQLHGEVQSMRSLLGWIVGAAATFGVVVLVKAFS